MAPQIQTHQDPGVITWPARGCRLRPHKLQLHEIQALQKGRDGPHRIVLLYVVVNRWRQQQSLAAMSAFDVAHSCSTSSRFNEHLILTARDPDSIFFSQHSTFALQFIFSKAAEFSHGLFSLGLRDLSDVCSTLLRVSLFVILGST